MMLLRLLVGLGLWLGCLHAFQVRPARHRCTRIFSEPNLLEMDVVVYSEPDDDSRRLGAVQEDGRITPLSVWSTDPVYGESLEFLVDEEDLFPGYTADTIQIHNVIEESKLSYGSRQVGGGKGPGNPHGEESELLYYVEQSELSDIDLIIKPELEILW